jgi:TRAP-type C4-dicarboxylate transport system permease small subunit
MAPLLPRMIVWLRRLLDTAAALLLAAVTGVTFVRVVGRYVFGHGMPWSEELTRFLFVWLIMIGAARAAHLRVDLLTNALGRRSRVRFEIAIAALGLVLLIFLVWKVLPLIELTKGDFYTALGISLQYVYYSVVVGGVLWALSIVLAIYLPPTDEEVPPS